ncbi:MAG: type II CAAX endopeptidase family protein [Thermoproteota archaeon]|mgnify:CR=1 FL=1|nr:type II CAAX endopeptidase family protein [Thermoproteota archaeon]
MASKNGWKVFLGPLLLLVISYIVYFVRYPMWGSSTIEPVFAGLILSYFAVLVLALVLIKKDMKANLSDIFKFKGAQAVFLGLLLAVLFQALWFGISLSLGGRLEFSSFPSLRGFENYAYYALPIAFALYLLFSIFGAFAEEVAYRGYAQSRIASRYGYAIGVFVSALLFSLQHIHIFQANWIERFFQGQFIYVLLFGIFVGYFFMKSKENLWAVFAFHALMNTFNITLPVQVTTPFLYTELLRTILCFMALIIVLRILPFTKNANKKEII